MFGYCRSLWTAELTLSIWCLLLTCDQFCEKRHRGILEAPPCARLSQAAGTIASFPLAREWSPHPVDAQLPSAACFPTFPSNFASMSYCSCTQGCHAAIPQKRAKINAIMRLGSKDTVAEEERTKLPRDFVPRLGRFQPQANIRVLEQSSIVHKLKYAGDAVCDEQSGGV